MQEIVKEAEEDDEEKPEQVFIDEIPNREKPPRQEVTPVIQERDLELEDYKYIIVLGSVFLIVVVVIFSVIYCLKKQLCVKRRRDNIIFIDNPIKSDEMRPAEPIVNISNITQEEEEVKKIQLEP